MINNTNEEKLSKYKTEESLIIRMLDKTLSLKVIQSVIFSINTYEHNMIAVGNKNKNIKNKYRWNYCHHMPILPLLRANHLLPLLHKAKRFIWIE